MSVAVIDPYGVSADAAMPTLSLAVDPVLVRRNFKRRLPGLAGRDGKAKAKAIRVIRYRPGRRCLIQYDVRIERPGARPRMYTILGKVRRRQFGKSDFRLMRMLRRAGFDEQSADGICVPKPLGVLPMFRMWLQLKVPGRSASELLAEPGGVELARRVAEAAHKVHRCRLWTAKRHRMSDELRIVRQCLQQVAAAQPQWKSRLKNVFRACQRLAKATPRSRPCCIHRDFYADQVLVAGKRLYLLDFDLYCRGDSALDIGNFLGHVTEQSLRNHKNANALGDVERALEERFVELAGEAVRPAVQAYSLLTLVRHIYLSTQFAERRYLTESLIQLCEERLGIDAPAATVNAAAEASCTNRRTS